MPTRAVLTAGVLALSLLSASPAAEAVEAGEATTSLNQRCTIMGTQGDDVLRGTPGRDIICGRTGNDVLLGRGGDDVLLGGPGQDRLEGGPGDDRLKGQDQPDRLLGQAGDDVLFGDSGDHDELLGGDGRDDLYENKGLSDGGPGTDYCPWDGPTTACETWDETETVLAGSNIPDVLELSGKPRTWRVRLHLRDPLGVDYAHVSYGRESDPPFDGKVYDMRRASGTARDGWWVADVPLAAHLASSDYDVSAYAKTRALAYSQTWDRTVAVVNSDSDSVQPSVTATRGIDAGEQFALSDPPVLWVEAADDLAGVGIVRIVWENTETRDRVRTEAVRTAGNARSGTWRARLDRPKRIGPGPAEFTIVVIDRAGNGIAYYGPSEREFLEHYGRPAPAIPEGKGAFELVP